MTSLDLAALRARVQFRLLCLDERRRHAKPRPDDYHFCTVCGRESYVTWEQCRVSTAPEVGERPLPGLRRVRVEAWRDSRRDASLPDHREERGMQERERAEELAHGGLVSREGDMVTLGDGSRWWLNGTAWARDEVDALIVRDRARMIERTPR